MVTKKELNILKIFTKDEGLAIATLCTGTFLEYFDFWLYIHFAVVLNKVFFASGDAQSSAILISTAYFITYGFRPIGALLFGYIGDKYGRKSAINMTLWMMGVTCFGIFFLPGYDKIGVWASVLITVFRVIQSFTTVGEVTGSYIYLMEYLKGKKIFVALALVSAGTYLGGQFAVHCVDFALSGFINWRYMFIFGLLIFIVGNDVRKHLKETEDFINEKKKEVKDTTKVSKRSFWHACVINTMQPVTWFIVAVGFNNILRETYNYNDLMIAKNNVTIFWMGFLDVLAVVWLTYYYSPIKIVKIRNIINNILLLISPLVIIYHSEPYHIIVFQSLLLIFGLGDQIILPFVFREIPVLKRFKAGVMFFVIPRAFVAFLTSFGIILAQKYLHQYTFAIFALPFTLTAYFSIDFFEKKDRNKVNGYLKEYEEL